MDNQIQKNKAIYLEISAKSLQNRFVSCTDAVFIKHFPKLQ